MSFELKKDIWYVIKTATFMICLAGFVANSSMIVKQFIGKQTITSQNLEHNKELYLPSFTICSPRGYKEKIKKFQDLKLNNYLEKTLGLDEVLFRVNEMTIEKLIENTTFWQVTTTYARFKGCCHTIRYLKKVL